MIQSGIRSVLLPEGTYSLDESGRDDQKRRLEGCDSDPTERLGGDGRGWEATERLVCSY
jgi:hypothetical protein